LARISFGGVKFGTGPVDEWKNGNPFGPLGEEGLVDIRAYGGGKLINMVEGGLCGGTGRN
jgi:hypothetical protein